MTTPLDIAFRRTNEEAWEDGEEVPSVGRPSFLRRRLLSSLWTVRQRGEMIVKRFGARITQRIVGGIARVYFEPYQKCPSAFLRTVLADTPCPLDRLPRIRFVAFVE